MLNFSLHIKGNRENIVGYSALAAVHTIFTHNAPGANVFVYAPGILGKETKLIKIIKGHFRIMSMLKRCTNYYIQSTGRIPLCYSFDLVVYCIK